MSHLTLQQQIELTQVLPDALFVEQPGRMELVEHCIFLIDHQPFHQAVYHIPECLLMVLKEELDMMQSLGVIEPFDSEWCIPTILVPKKDGSLQFCLDFSKVNTVSKFEPYPMPRIDAMVECLGKTKFLTTPNLCKVCWQVPIATKSCDVTALKGPFRHYQFTVLLFGLHGALSF